MLQQSVEQVQAWSRQGFGVTLSCNLSSRWLRNQPIRDWLEHLAASSDFDGTGLELEITETSLIENLDEALIGLQDCRALLPGLRIAIDDFGTGHSSLSYLRYLPVDTLKIDRSFLADFADPSVPAANIVRAILTAIARLGSDIGLGVVVEGVETAAQLELLRQLNVDEAQGFYLALPLARTDFEALLTPQANDKTPS